MASPEHIAKSEAAYQVIKKAIRTTELSPGTQVSESSLCDAYDISRASIRAALKRLTQEQLVEPIPRQGYVVAPITVKDVAELYELRLLFKPYAARMAASKLSKSQLDQLHELCGATNVTLQSIGVDNYLERHAAFHLEIARSTGNDRLVEMIAGVLEEMERVFRISIIQVPDSNDIFRKHRQLIDLLASRDEEGAERHERERIESARNRVLTNLFSSTQVQYMTLKRPD